MRILLPILLALFPLIESCGPRSSRILSAIQFAEPVVFVPPQKGDIVGKQIVIKINNNTPAALELEEFRTGCGCLKLIDPPKWLKAKSTTEVNLAFRERRPVGAFNVTIVAKARGNPGDVTSMSVRGCILPSNGVLVEPLAIDFGRVREGSISADRTVVVSLTEGDGEVRMEVDGGYDVNPSTPAAPQDDLPGLKVHSFRIKRKPGAISDSEARVVVDGKIAERVRITAVREVLQTVVPKVVLLNRETGASATLLLLKGKRMVEVPGVLFERVASSSDAYDAWKLSVPDSSRLPVDSQLDLAVADEEKGRTSESTHATLSLLTN
jgi:hypothetical protein